MPCFHPLKAYKSRERNPATGLYLIMFNPLKALVEASSFSVPCGQCIGCKIARAEQLMVRCVHESKMHAENCFLTLTFDNQHLPENYSVSKPEFQNFMKRLRKSLEPKKIRFLGTGEYGEHTLRPHYHALIFGHRPTDLKRYSQTKQGFILYNSNQISEVWPYGDVKVGSVDAGSAGYVARYALKKLHGSNEYTAAHYTRQHPISGQFYVVEPEFALYSRRPGLGSTWFDKYKSDCFPSDFLALNDGRLCAVPQYYSRKLEKEALETKRIKWKRKAHAVRNREHSTPQRLQVREEIKTSKIKLLKREL